MSDGTTGTDEARIQQLAAGPLQEVAFFAETYGLDEGQLSILEGDVNKWAGGKHVFKSGSRWCRWTLERYCQAFEVLPPAFAAYDMGFTPSSLASVLSIAQNLLPDGSLGLGPLLSRKLVRRLQAALPQPASSGPRPAVATHSSRCRELHAALEVAGASIEPSKDPFSDKRGDEPPDLAASIDVIAKVGVGMRNAVWLNFGKPMSLAPDRTSIITYVRCEALLADYIAEHAPPKQELVNQARALAGG